jgi:hypothetical protein
MHLTSRITTRKIWVADGMAVGNLATDEYSALAQKSLLELKSIVLSHQPRVLQHLSIVSLSGA